MVYSMEETENNKNILNLIEALSKINRKDLNRLRDFIKSINPNEPDSKNLKAKNTRKGYLTLADNDKIEIIGGLPFLLNDINHFPTTESIKKFSEDLLNIPIPKGNKTRPELIGIIIVKIAELPNFKTHQINNTLNAVIKNVKSSSSKNIFLEWEKAIKSI
jgi:hypothetical protein